MSYCSNCRAAALKKHIERDCYDCPNREPVLLSENEDIWEVFILCETQLRAGFGGAYALDWNVTIKAAESRGLEINPQFFVLLKCFEQTFMEKLNEEKDHGSR